MLPKRLNINRAMKLRQLFAATLQEQTMMAIARHGETQQFSQRNLQARRRHQIATPHNTVDPFCRVIKDGNEVVTKGAVAAAQNRISKICGGVAGKIGPRLVSQLDPFRGKFESKRLRFVPPITNRYASSATGSWIRMTSIGSQAPSRANFRPTALTGINATFSDPFNKRRLVSFLRMGLHHDFVPLETKPLEVSTQPIDIAWLRSIEIKVLEAQYDFGPRAPRIQPTKECGEQGPGMSRTGRRRSEPTARKRRTPSHICFQSHRNPMIL